MKYTIELFSKKAVEVEADSPHEAIKAVNAGNPDYKADYIYDIRGNSEINYCECGNPILNYEPYIIHESGCTNCADCIAMFEELADTVDDDDIDY